MSGDTNFPFHRICQAEYAIDGIMWPDGQLAIINKNNVLVKELSFADLRAPKIGPIRDRVAM